MLTDAGIKAYTKYKFYKIADRDGMYVLVQPSGAVVFRYDYRLNCRHETLTLGRYGATGLSLVRAREKLIDAQRAILARRPVICLEEAARRALPQGSKELRCVWRMLVL